MALPDIQNKQDAITLRLEQGAKWVMDHWQQVLIGLAAVTVAAALSIFVVHNLRKLRMLAWEQLASAQGMASRGQRAEALRVVDQLLATARSGPLVSQAHLFKGDVLLMERKLDEATAAYENAAQQATSPELSALAAAGKTIAIEQNQKWDKAEEEYAQFVRSYPDHFLAARMYEALGRVQMIQQKWTDAQATLERLVTLYPTSPWAKNAQQYLHVIKAQIGQAEDGS